ncbi:MAG TPA: threonine synthase, partial [Methylomirabilota bacterium]|nr:threonine synthase [Methylomirabilota bacterium]
MMNPTPVSPGAAASWRGVIHRYAEHLPVSAATPVITLLEGNTPLVPAPRFVEAIGGKFHLF